MPGGSNSLGAFEENLGVVTVVCVCFHITFGWKVDLEYGGRGFFPGVSYLVHAGNNPCGQLNFIQIVPVEGEMSFAIEFMGYCFICFLNHLLFPQNGIDLVFIAEEGLRSKRWRLKQRESLLRVIRVIGLTKIRPRLWLFLTS